jgi:hypothetical protein
MTQTSSIKQRISPGEAVAKLRAQGFDVTERSVQKWCSEKRLKQARKLGGRWFIDFDELEQMLR